MSMNTKKNVAIVLLVVSMLLWVLRKLNVLYIPAPKSDKERGLCRNAGG